MSSSEAKRAIGYQLLAFVVLVLVAWAISEPAPGATPVAVPASKPLRLSPELLEYERRGWDALELDGDRALDLEGVVY